MTVSDRRTSRAALGPPVVLTAFDDDPGIRFALPSAAQPAAAIGFPTKVGQGPPYEKTNRLTESDETACAPSPSELESLVMSIIDA